MDQAIKKPQEILKNRYNSYEYMVMHTHIFLFITLDQRSNGKVKALFFSI